MKTTLSKARVGFLIFIGVLTFTIAIFFVGEKSQLFSSVFYTYVNFTAAEGVKPGAAVVLSGYNVGTVIDISLSPTADSVRLLLRVSEEVRPFIKKDSRAQIKQEGLVGNKIINLVIGSAESPLVENYGFINGEPPFALTGMVDNVTAIMDTTKQLIGDLNRLVESINRGEGTVGKLLTDDEIYRNLASVTASADEGLKIAVAQINDLTRQLSKTAKTIDVIASQTDTVILNTNILTAEAVKTMKNLNDGKGTVGALMTDRALYDSLITLITALTYATYDAGDAADQATRSIHAMRQHWLFGRVFTDEEFDEELPPEPSYKELMQSLQRRQRELDARERQIRLREKELGEQ